jgi:hypothetical protein
MRRTGTKNSQPDTEAAGVAAEVEEEEEQHFQLLRRARRCRGQTRPDRRSGKR